MIFALASCSKDITIVPSGTPGDPAQEPEGRWISVEASGDSDDAGDSAKSSAQTRVTIENLRVRWAADDKFEMFFWNRLEGAAETISAGTYTLDSDPGMASGSFSGFLPAAADKDGEFYAAHGYMSDGSCAFSDVDGKAGYFTVSVETDQVQNGPFDPESLGRYSRFWGKDRIETFSSSDPRRSPQFTFLPLTCILDVKVARMHANERLKSVAIAADYTDSENPCTAPFMSSWRVGKEYVIGKGFPLAEVVDSSCYSNYIRVRFPKPLGGTNLTASLVLLPRDNANVPAANGPTNSRTIFLVFRTEISGDAQDHIYIVKKTVNFSNFKPGFRYPTTVDITEVEAMSPLPAFQNNTILVANRAQLDWCRANSLIFDNYSGYTISVQNDIDLGGSGNPWLPLCMSGSFRGSFDGGNHTISNMYCVADVSATRYPSLLGYVAGTESEKVEVRNVRMSNAVVKLTDGSGYNYVGALAGYASCARFVNCSSQNGLIATLSADGIGYVGGMVGSFYKGMIENCKVIGGSVEASDNTLKKASRNFYAGGLAGYVNYSSIKNCSNSTDLNKERYRVIGTRIYMGGLVGYMNYSMIFGSKNSGEVYSRSWDCDSYIGGVTGYAYVSNIVCCYNEADITSNLTYASNACYAGGIAGFMCATQGTKLIISNSVPSKMLICYNNGFVKDEDGQVDYVRGDARLLVGGMTTGLLDVIYEYVIFANVAQRQYTYNAFGMPTVSDYSAAWNYERIDYDADGDRWPSYITQFYVWTGSVEPESDWQWNCGKCLPQVQFEGFDTWENPWTMHTAPVWPTLTGFVESETMPN